MKTDTRSWVPTVPPTVAGLEGHELELVGTIQMVPVNCPWAGVVAGMRNMMPSSKRTEEYTIFLVMSCAYFSEARDSWR